MFVFGGLKSLLPKFNATTIDNSVFRLHYRFTVLILVAFILLSTAKEYLGDPIRCQATDDSIKAEVLDQFCWVQSTYSVPDHWHKKVGDEVPYHGIGKANDEESKVYHKYYQWVVFMLFAQAVLFYAPRYMWKMWEGGKIKMLVMGLDNPLCDAVEKKEKYKMLANHFENRLNTNKRYAAGYVFCELLNFANIIGQIYLTDRFLGYTFTTFGSDVINFMNSEQQDRTDPMIMIFPRMTLCEFFRIGFGGKPELKNAFCVLPLNIVNEKIYIFLWFWFIFLATVTAANVVYRLITLMVPAVREMLLRAKADLVSAKVIRQVLSRYDFSDWFLLYTLCKNMDGVNFKELTQQMVHTDLYPKPELDSKMV